MPVSSMTGFARFEGQVEGAGFVWELRSVNGKGLELRIRLPQGFESIEVEVRRRLGASLSRGNLQVSLTLDRPEGLSNFAINHAFLDELLRLSDEIVRSERAAPPRADGLLGLRGVIEVSDESHSSDWFAARAPAVLQGLDGAIAALVAARQSEGLALKAILDGRVDEIEALAKAATDDPSRSLAAIQARLQRQVSELLGLDAGLDAARLHQEAAMIAAKADIQEELDRLTAHVAAARTLLREGGPVGRRLDFLSQEFNRESNTICSKSHTASLTAIGLQLKTVVDQFREQVQNLE